MDWVDGTECNLKMEKRYLPWALIPPPPRWTSNQARLSILAEVQIQIRDGTTISAEGLFSVVTICNLQTTTTVSIFLKMCHMISIFR